MVSVHIVVKLLIAIASLRIMNQIINKKNSVLIFKMHRKIHLCVQIVDIFCKYENFVLKVGKYTSMMNT